MRVKICGLTRLEDAEAALEFGADALGFVCEPTSGRSIMDRPESLEIPRRMGPYTLCVAVLGPYRPTPHAFHAVQSIEPLPDSDRRPSILAIRVKSGATADEVLALIGNSPSVLLDADHASAFGGTGTRIDWPLAAEVVRRSEAKIILAGGLTPENVAEAIRVVRPYAVDVSGGVEAALGIKDPVKLRDFIQAAKG